MLAEALRWLDAGFRPIAVRDKRPIEKGWPDLDPERIRAWRTWPGDSIGVVTGDGYAVADADTPEALEAMAALGLPPTFGYATKRGAHRWYAVDGPVRSSAGALAPDLDVKGERSYVKVPPSPGYAYDASSELGITAIPATILIPLDRQRGPLKGPRYGGPPESVTEGGRHDAASRYAGHLWAMRADEAELTDALFAWNELACVPPLPDEELLGIVRWIVARPS